MNKTETKKEDRLPRIVCAFAAFFTIAIPAFSACVGKGTHSTWVELASGLEAQGICPPIALSLLNYNQIFLWALFAIAVILAGMILSLYRKNSTAGTLNGTGRIVFALGLSAILSTFYLAMLAIVASLLLIPFLTK